MSPWNASEYPLLFKIKFDHANCEPHKFTCGIEKTKLEEA